MSVFRALIVVAAALALSACNTVHGFGKDLEKVGDQIQEKSKK
ncbi:entericidin A/B family lipoprotein [Niveibacterium sp. 24ML]|nr:entericidin A/B family lipoprotein [Niveibacterium sp. 24ML]